MHSKMYQQCYSSKCDKDVAIPYSYFLQSTALVPRVARSISLDVYSVTDMPRGRSTSDTDTSPGRSANNSILFTKHKHNNKTIIVHAEHSSPAKKILYAPFIYLKKI